MATDRKRKPPRRGESIERPARKFRACDDDQEVAIKRLQEEHELRWAERELAFREQLASLIEANQRHNQERRQEVNQKHDVEHRQEKRRSSTSKRAREPVVGPTGQNLSDHHKSLRQRDKNQWKRKETELAEQINDQQNQIRGLNERLRESQDKCVSLQKDYDRLKVEADKHKIASITRVRQADGSSELKELTSRLQNSEEARRNLESQVSELQERLDVGWNLNDLSGRLSELEEEITALRLSERNLEVEVSARDDRITTLTLEQEALRLSGQEKATRLEESETALMDLRT
ncbi:hypothetical protein V5O48_018616, partial [Marasmius crinis-equi]